MVENVSVSLGDYQDLVNRVLAELLKDKTMARIWSKDYTVWNPSPTEISNRLGWLESPHLMADRLPEIRGFVNAVRRAGYTRMLLLGMGGSSLAPEVFRKVFGVAEGFLDLAVIDSTDPAVILDWTRKLSLEKTLFLVSTKSGGTVETFSFLKYFYNRVLEALGPNEAGWHFAAITDPGSGLADLAQVLRFRHVFYNDPNMGGRYSALSYFGLVPAALIGMEPGKFLNRAIATIEEEQTDQSLRGLAAVLGVMMGELAKAGRDKLTFVFSPELAAFGDWLEQLIAESTGKEGKGVLPVVGEPLGPPDVYGPDRLFVAIRLADDREYDSALDLLDKAGHPVIRLDIQDRVDLGGQCFLWELATAVAGACLGINPFDQPNVESAKAFARQIVAQCMEQGRLPEERPDYTEGIVAVFGESAGQTLRDKVDHFVCQGVPGAYVAIQAYVAPTPATDAVLQKIRLTFRNRYRLATTIGYGPRFLHSTGQLHKGDAGRGLFLQITVDDPEDAAIPDQAGEKASALSFGTLKAAQALGDRRALQEAGRRVMRLHLVGNAIPSLMPLIL